MKTRAALLITFCLLSACSQKNFVPGELMAAQIGEEFPPVDHVDPIPEPEPLRKMGACVDQESVASCLKCENPLPPPEPPRALSKGQKLAKIMAMSCQIYNKSYPRGYVAPSAAQIEAQMLACTKDIYPETATSSAQAATIDRLLNESDDSLRQKMFKGMWFQPPYTGHFETYFGLDGAEAAYAFCLNAGASTISGELYTTERAMAEGREGGYEMWLRDPAAQARWNAAQTIRKQLQSCFNKPGTVEPEPTPNPVPQKKCEYKSFEGRYEKGGKKEIKDLLEEGYKVAIEGNLMCAQVTVVPEDDAFKGNLRIVGYRCQ